MKTYFFLFFAAVCIAGIVAASTLYKDQVISQMNEWKLLPQPETFTELYFENHLELPKQLTADTTKDISFTVHNLEYQDMVYEYSVKAVATDSATVLATGTISLPQDGYKTVTLPVTLPEMKYRTKVTVTLENLKQSIHFWVDPLSPPPPTAEPTDL